MGILQTIKNAISTKRVSGVELVTTRGNNYIAWRGKVYDSDVVKSCIRPKVKAIGKLVAKHIRESIDEDVNPLNSVRFLLEEPNPLMTGQMLQEKLATQLCLNPEFPVIMLTTHKQ